MNYKTNRGSISYKRKTHCSLVEQAAARSASECGGPRVKRRGVSGAVTWLTVDCSESTKHETQRNKRM